MAGLFIGQAWSCSKHIDNIMFAVPQADLAPQLMPSVSYDNDLFEMEGLPAATPSELRVLEMVEEGVLDLAAALSTLSFQVCMQI